MTVASTATVVSNANTAAFDIWVNEVYTQWVTNCGLTQLSATMDSGQLAVPTSVSLPAINTAAGYWMFVFKDTLASGPLVTGTALAALTAGTGYNGGSSGTFTGVQGSGGANSAARYTVVLGASGVISSITPTTAGSGSFIGDQITITSANMVTAGAAAGGGSSGSAFVNQLTSAASPVIIKMEFGQGSITGNPQMWITIGTSWTSSGTLGAAQNGAVTTRVAVLSGVAPASTSVAYVSRYVYNATYGYLGMVFKIGGITTNIALGSLILYRTSDTNGNSIGNAVALITNSASATGTGNAVSAGTQQCMSYTANVIYPGTFNTTNGAGWPAIQGIFPAALTSTLEAGTIFIFPSYTVDPVIRFSGVVGVASTNDIPVGSTASCAIIGSTAITFLQCGLCFGCSTGFSSISLASLGFMLLWQ